MDTILPSAVSFKFHFDSINISRGIGTTYFHEHFKFHFDSININGAQEMSTSVVNFKFHFDSINIEENEITERRDAALNSTLILLISFATAVFSIFLKTFKFHFDSINITVSQSRSSSSSSFKFHFDSINIVSS